MWSNRYPVSRHRTALQLLATLANLATTWRCLQDYKLPGVFLCLPLGLLLLPLLERYTVLLDDRFTRLAVTGVATGVNCGFLSTVANVYRTQLLYLEPLTKPQGWLDAMQALELLHIPVLAVTWIDSFLRLLDRLPTQRSLQVAAMTALVADLLVMVGLAVLRDTDLLSLDAMNIFLLFYIHALLVACMPLFRDASRAWVLLLTLCSASLQWQVACLGVVTWEHETYRFPVPGYLIGLLYVFHCESPSTLQGFGSNQERDAQIIPNMRLFWIGVAFVFERIALNGIYKKHASADTFSACVVTVLQGCLISPVFRGSQTWRVAGSLGCCLSYLLHNLVAGQLYNPLLLDLCMALCLLHIVNNTPVSLRNDFPRVKLSIL